MPGLSATERRRLIAALGLLSSPVDGEALAAARATTRLIAATALAWDQVITPAVARVPVYRPPMPALPTVEEAEADPRRAAAALVSRDGVRLSAKELRFLTKLTGWGGPVSPAQVDWVCRIIERQERRAA